MEKRKSTVESRRLKRAIMGNDEVRNYYVPLCSEFNLELRQLARKIVLDGSIPTGDKLPS